MNFWTCDTCGYDKNKYSDDNCLKCGEPFKFTFSSARSSSAAARAAFVPGSSTSPGAASAASPFTISPPGVFNAKLAAARAAAPTGSWVCSLCTYENEDTDPACKMCNNPKPSAAASSSSSAAARAAYVPPPGYPGASNPFTFSTPGAASMFSPAASTATWECSLCTYINKDTDMSCEACGNPKPSAAAASGFSSSSASACNTKDYFVKESDKVTAVCRIPMIEEIVKRSRYGPIHVDLGPEQRFARLMFGYDERETREKYDQLEPGGKAVLNTPNGSLNAAYIDEKNGRTRRPGDLDSIDAHQMGKIFDTVIREKTFETKKHGIVYRSWTDGIDTARMICSDNIGRYTSTSVRKQYSDSWGTGETIGLRNDGGFFATIIIPSDTTSVIPLLLFDELGLKTAQYEVLLDPEGRFIDTGYIDTTGYKVIVYLGPEKRHLFSSSLSEILSLRDSTGTNIKGLILNVIDAKITGGKRTKRNKRTRRRRTRRF